MVSTTSENFIPVEWFVDEYLFLQEYRKIFTPDTHSYFSHITTVPNTNDYFVLPTTNNSKLLVNNENSLEVISNICRHRQNKMI